MLLLSSPADTELWRQSRQGVVA